MGERNLLARSMHDVGLAAWFGGSLMGAIGLNGATAEAKEPSERLRLSSLGWARWTPVQLGALIIHGIGGLGVIRGNKGRLVIQQESRTNTMWKAIITGLALGSTVYSGVLGKVMSDHRHEPTAGVAEPHHEASNRLESAQRQQKILQWLTPALTLVIIVLAAQQGEQQRPIKGLFQTTLKNLKR